ncbi:hypothetical protein BC829DRAFT_233680 [Chytridium lagenaria]|nr:hypothetical protein BC829DRAFT_233680 [Chytridium lagenaria]
MPTAPYKPSTQMIYTETPPEKAPSSNILAPQNNPSALTEKLQEKGFPHRCPTEPPSTVSRRQPPRQ